MNGRTWLAAAAIFATGGFSAADDVKYVVRDGVTYRETRRVERTPVVENGWVERTRTVYREQCSTENRTRSRTVYSRDTDYVCESRWHNWWNPLGPPEVAYYLRPVHRWTARVETYQSPVTVRQVVPEKQVVRVPVRKLRMAEREVVDRVPANGSFLTATRAPRSTSDSTPYGGVVRLDNDPPRMGSQMTTASPALRR